MTALFENVQALGLLIQALGAVLIALLCLMLNRVERYSARRIRTAVNEPMALHNVTIRVQLSIGISTYSDDGTTADVLMQHADVALYQAKASDRNGHRLSAETPLQVGYSASGRSRTRSPAHGVRRPEADRDGTPSRNRGSGLPRRRAVRSGRFDGNQSIHRCRFDR